MVHTLQLALDPPAPLLPPWPINDEQVNKAVLLAGETIIP